MVIAPAVGAHCRHRRWVRRGVRNAGVLFALEVPTRGRLQPVRALLGPCLLASLIGDGVTRWLGVDHDVMPRFPPVAHDLVTYPKFVVLGLAAGYTTLIYVVAVELFGADALPFAAVTLAVATVASTSRSIYTTQRAVT